MVVKRVGCVKGTPELVVEIVLSRGGADVLILVGIMAVLSESGADVLIEDSSLVEIMAVLSEGGADVFIEEKGCVR